ncbi:hypothetical protein OXX80_006527 [Metschnikowia pulcherrima]
MNSSTVPRSASESFSERRFLEIKFLHQLIILKMSTNQHHKAHAAENPAGGSGIRLPPISFISTGHQSQPISSMAQSLEKPNHGENKKIGGFKFQSIKQPFSGDQKMSLPEPQALNLYPKRTSHSPQSAESSAGFVDAQKPEPTISHQQYHQPTKAPSLNKMQPSGPLHDQDEPKDHHSQTPRIHHHHHHHSHPNPNPNHHHHHRARITQNHSPSIITNTKSASHDGVIGDNKALQARVAENRQNQAKRQKKMLHSKIYDQLAKDFPHRRHLGMIVYNPTTRWETLQFEQLHGLSEHDMRRLRSLRAEFLEHTREIGYGEKTAYVPIIPPLSEAYINNLLEVKIPYKFIKNFHENLARGVVERERKLWGGYAGIYTDDSDLLHVLCHLGLFNGKLDLTECNSEWTERDVTRPAHVQEDDDGVELLDLSVTILLLPGLVQYRGFCRNGLNSRSWVDKPAHSGLSIAVYNVKWETVFSALGERALSKRAAKEYMDDKISSAEFSAQKNGWSFDSALYQTLRKKMRAAKSTDSSAAADHVP